MIIQYRLLGFLLLFVLVTRCENSQSMSLERYFVDHQELVHFSVKDIPLDLFPAAMLEKLSNTQRDVLKTVHRFNVIWYDAPDVESFTKELKKVKTVLKNPKYNDLAFININGNMFEIKCVGVGSQTDEIDVRLTSRETSRFAVIRILGENMALDKILGIMINLDGLNLQTIPFWN